jgi:putative radical SAM enzyme (TIGR03279 family)
MSLPRIVAVAPGSPAARAGLLPADEIVAMNGRAPRDVIEYQVLADEATLEVDVRRGGLEVTLVVDNDAVEPLGIEIDSPVFDRVRTCDNHCEFCFIYQLPKGLRPSLYVKDDDYRLSFLYGNFTTLTRFTEADLERVVTERLSPLYVSIHATDPELRTRMLRNRRGATSLRWLRALLDHGIEVHGQVVVCPGVNDGAALDDTLTGVLDRYADLATAAVVPLGVSRYTTEPAMRPHTTDEAAAVVDQVEAAQRDFLAAVGRRVVFAADEYYLLAGRELPAADAYEGFPQHENGIGMARAFEAAFRGAARPIPVHSGFFASLEGAPADGYRAPRTRAPLDTDAAGRGPIAVLTGEYGASVIEPLVADRDDVRVIAVRNEFFGGNIGVTGLLAGADVARTLAGQPDGDRYLLPDVCLSRDTFIDGLTVADLPRRVEVVATDGRSLRRALSEPEAKPEGDRERSS